MNNDLISREALKVAINSNIEQATKVGIVVDADYLWELLNFAIDNAPAVENITVFTESTDEKAIADLKEELQKIIAEKRPKGKWYEYLDKGLLKARHGNYVVYDIDYLFEHLIRELNLMESARQMKGGADNDE